MFYVCDTCGHLEDREAVPEGDAWTCDTCGGHAAWEFPPQRQPSAETHAARIASLNVDLSYRKLR